MYTVFSRLKIVLTAMVLLMLPVWVCGQSFLKKENNIWLNNGEGIDFNSGSPQSVSSSWENYSLNTGSASVCDAQGHLLFYTDGNIVWDKNNDIMLHGWDINNNGNLAPNTCFIEPAFGLSSDNFDGVIITPMPGSSHKYYIFSSPLIWNKNSIGLYSGEWQGKLYASIVDMEANNGLGQVEPASRGRVIADEMAGNLHAVTGEDCNYWLLGFGHDGSYKAFNITATGIDTVPVLSTLTPPLNTYVSELNLSPNRQKMAMALSDEVQTADFDPATGIFSNDITVGAQDCSYTAFSPNSALLYFSGLIGVRQYDLSSFAFTLLTFNNMTDYEYNAPLRLGPDGRIYLSYYDGIFSVSAHIQQPDIFGTGCQMNLLTNPSLSLLENDWVQDYQFPNEVPVQIYDTVSQVIAAPLCFYQPTLLDPTSLSGTDYHWMVNQEGNTFVREGTDTTSTLLATVPGKYAVHYFTANPCSFHQDTFLVKDVVYTLYLGEDRMSCEGKPLTLSVAIPGASLLWSDGSTTDEYQVDHSGTYWVQADKEGCTARDTVAISIIDIRQDLGADTTICLEEKGQQVSLSAKVTEGSSVLWSNGSTQPSIAVADSGLYWVAVHNGICMATDSVFLHKQYCDCPILVPTAFSPNGDGNNDLFLPVIPVSCQVETFKLQIYNQWGQLIFDSYREGQGWDGTYNGLPADVGTYMYRLQMKTGLYKKNLVKTGDVVLIR